MSFIEENEYYIVQCPHVINTRVLHTPRFKHIKIETHTKSNGHLLTDKGYLHLRIYKKVEDHLFHTRVETL